jgi:hypothetical protein
MNTLNTRMSPVSRREITHRFASLGLAVVMTLCLLGSINLLAVEPAADSLLAQHSTLVASAPASSPNA